MSPLGWMQHTLISFLEQNECRHSSSFRSLYIQGLSAFQNKDENYFLSYFQIAGIHGRKRTLDKFELLDTDSV